MKNKALAIFGVITWILSVLSSAEDLNGNYKAPTAFIVVSAIAMLAFMIMAVVRLWKSQKLAAVLFIVSTLVSLVYVSAPIKIINFLVFFWIVFLLWAMGKYENPDEKLRKELGLIPEEFAVLKKHLEKKDNNKK